MSQMPWDVKPSKFDPVMVKITFEHDTAYVWCEGYSSWLYDPYAVTVYSDLPFFKWRLARAVKKRKSLPPRELTVTEP